MEALSHTSRQEFMTCPRKWYLSRMLRIEKVRDPSGLRMGKAQANAIEAAFRLTGPVTLAARQVAAIDSIEAEYAEARKTASSEDWDRLLLEEAQLKVLAPAYIARYPAGKLAASYAAKHAVISPEVEFEDPILGRGKIDAIVTLADGPNIGKRIGVEDKLLTPGFWRNADEKALRINAQVTAYFAAMREAGMPIDELRYRVTFKPSIKPNSRTKETLTEYVKRLTDRVENEEGYAFREYELFRTSDELDAFMARTQSVNRMVHRAKLDVKKFGEAAFPANLGQSCTQFGECEMLELCTLGRGATGYRIKPTRPRLTAIQKDCLGALDNAFHPEVRIADVSRITGRASVRNPLERLVSHGLATKDKRGKAAVYIITEAGREWLNRG